MRVCSAHLVNGGWPDDLARDDEVGRRSAVYILLPHVVVVHLGDPLLIDVAQDLPLPLADQGQQQQQQRRHRQFRRHG